jgi:hypothetical protein
MFEQSEYLSFNVPHSSSADLATAVHNFIINDPNLHQKVLLYEPIWVEQLHADLKANNLRFKLHKLMDYLDEQVRKKWIFAVYNIKRGMETLCVNNPDYPCFSYACTALIYLGTGT